MLLEIHDLFKAYPSVKTTALESVLIDQSRRVWLSLHVSEATVLRNRNDGFGVIWVGEYVNDDLERIPMDVLIIDSDTPRQNNDFRFKMSYPFVHALA